MKTGSIPDDELSFSYIRASGPGGQNVNKVSTAVELRFDVRNSPSLPIEIKERLSRIAGKNMTQSGKLVIHARRYRTQEQNRTDALLRLGRLLEKASQKPGVRRATRPSLTSRLRRVESKKKHSSLKKNRHSIDEW